MNHSFDVKREFFLGQALGRAYNAAQGVSPEASHYICRAINNSAWCVRGFNNTVRYNTRATQTKE